MKIKIILCVCLAVCLTALGVSGFMLYHDYAQRQNDQNAFEQLDEVTRATNDEAVPVSEAKELDDLLKDSALIILPGTHYCYLENLNQVVNILYNFI